MRDIYLGDSYDLVKRFWREQLMPIAPLLGHPRFVPESLRGRFTLLTTIPFFEPEKTPAAPFGLFLDPHTGIPLPKEGVTKATIEHAPLPFIADEMKRLSPKYAICFDQSHHRQHKLDGDEQKDLKRQCLRERGIASFYYLSHAPFLFMAKAASDLEAVRQRLIDIGIPAETPNGVRLQAVLS